MYAEYTKLQLTFLTLQPCYMVYTWKKVYIIFSDLFYIYSVQCTVYIIQGAITYVYMNLYIYTYTTPICLSMFASPGYFSVFVTSSSSIITCKPGFKGREGGRGWRATMIPAKWPSEPPYSQNDLQAPQNRLRASCYVPKPPPFSLYVSHFGFCLLWSGGHSLNQEAWR